MALAARPVEIKIRIANEPVDHEWSLDDKLPGSGHKPFGNE